QGSMPMANGTRSSCRDVLGDDWRCLAVGGGDCSVGRAPSKLVGWHQTNFSVWERNDRFSRIDPASLPFGLTGGIRSGNRSDALLFTRVGVSALLPHGDACDGVSVGARRLGSHFVSAGSPAGDGSRHLQFPDSYAPEPIPELTRWRLYRLKTSPGGDFSAKLESCCANQ